jgi:hypothetical protein
MSEHGRSTPEAEPQPDRKRLPYEPPAVISEEVFETLALSCAKANPFACPGGNPDRS